MPRTGRNQASFYFRVERHLACSGLTLFLVNSPLPRCSLPTSPLHSIRRTHAVLHRTRTPRYALRDARTRHAPPAAAATACTTRTCLPARLRERHASPSNNMRLDSIRTCGLPLLPVFLGVLLLSCDSYSPRTSLYGWVGCGSFSLPLVLLSFLSFNLVPAPLPRCWASTLTSLS